MVAEYVLEARDGGTATILEPSKVKTEAHSKIKKETDLHSEEEMNPEHAEVHAQPCLKPVLPSALQPTGVRAFGVC